LTKSTSNIIRTILLGIIYLAVSCNSHNGNNENNVEPVSVLELPPSPNNPRNSEGDFIELKSGKLLFIYTHYDTGSGVDHDPAYLASRNSVDAGMTWSDTDDIVMGNEGSQNIMSVSLLRLNNGDIALFYLRKNSSEDCIPIMRVSKDEARTWGPPVQCIGKKGYYVLNNDRVIQLNDGTLMFAVSEHKSKDKIFDAQGNLYAYFSEDNGKTWKSSKKVPNETKIITQEPGLIEMGDGRIMMFIRTNDGKQYLSYSSDKGLSWSHILPSNIPSPLSPASIEKIPGSNHWIMVWNNNDGSMTDIKNKRTPLTVAISKDEGVSWKNVKNIETEKDGWFCYTAIYFVKNDILLAYCAGDRSDKNYNGLARTRLAKLGRSWLYR